VSILRIGRENHVAMILAATTALVTLTGASPSFPAIHPTKPTLTLKMFQTRQISLRLPVVPTSIVAAPPKSHTQGVETQLPTSVLRAIYYHGSPNFGPPRGLGPDPRRTTIVENLDRDLGPARVYSLPYDLALYWAYGGSLRLCTLAGFCALGHVPPGLRPFIQGMERQHRPYRTVRSGGPPLSLPSRLPASSSWTLVQYSTRLPYLPHIILVLHRHTVWILFSGYPKAIVTPGVKVPETLVPAPPHAIVESDRTRTTAVVQHFGTLFAADTALPLGYKTMAGVERTIQPHFPRNTFIRVYHGSPRWMQVWFRDESQFLTEPDGGGGGAIARGTWKGIRWIALNWSGPRVNPEGDGAFDPPGSNWLLWIFVTPQGWAAIAAGPN